MHDLNEVEIKLIKNCANFSVFCKKSKNDSCRNCVFKYKTDAIEDCVDLFYAVKNDNNAIVVEEFRPTQFQYFLASAIAGGNDIHQAIGIANEACNHY